MAQRHLYSELSNLIQARKNCQEQRNIEWFNKHTDRILYLVAEYMPSGTGFDNGTKINLEESHAEKLVFYTEFHHMHDLGMYDGWTEHTVVVTPSFLSGLNMRVSGRNRNDIKDYIYEAFDLALKQEIKPDGNES